MCGKLAALHAGAMEVAAKDPAKPAADKKNGAIRTDTAIQFCQREVDYSAATLAAAVNFGASLPAAYSLAITASEIGLILPAWPSQPNS